MIGFPTRIQEKKTRWVVGRDFHFVRLDEPHFREYGSPLFSETQGTGIAFAGMPCMLLVLNLTRGEH